MADVDSVNNLDYRGDGTNTQMYSGSAPVVPTLPNTTYALTVATRINDNMRKTFDRLMAAVDAWNQLRDYYEGPDQEQVYKAFNDRIEKISAIRLAGESLYNAYAIYDASVDSEISGRREDYVGWVPGHVTASSPYEPYLGDWCRNQYGTADGLWDAMGTADEDKMRVLGEMNALKEDRITHKDSMNTLVFDFEKLRRAVATSLDELDMGELSRIRFETRNEATTTVESQEDIEAMLREAGAFDSLDLTDEEIERIAAEVWANREDYDFGQFTDEQGRDWVMTPEGTMVRAGSAMDPRFNAAVMRALAEDPVVGQREIDYPGMDPGQKITVEALIYGLNKGNSKFKEWGIKQFQGEDANILGMKVSSGMIGAGLTILTIGATASDYRTQQSMLYPMMSETDLGERYQHALVVEGAKAGGSVVLGGGLMFVAAAAGAPTGGVGGFVVAAVVDQITGAVVGWIVDTVSDNQTSATQDEINDMTDEELANQ